MLQRWIGIACAKGQRSTAVHAASSSTVPGSDRDMPSYLGPLAPCAERATIHQGNPIQRSPVYSRQGLPGCSKPLPAGFGLSSYRTSRARRKLCTNEKFERFPARGSRRTRLYLHDRDDRRGQRRNAHLRNRSRRKPMLHNPYKPLQALLELLMPLPRAGVVFAHQEYRRRIRG